MPRYRIMFSKFGPAKYISHLDLMKAFERSFKRADLPLALTQGFNPHPVMSFAAPVPVGMHGEEEYLDMELTNSMDPESVKVALAEVMPEGLMVRNIRRVEQGAPSTMAVVNLATYKVFGWDKEFTVEELNSKLEEFLKSSDIMVEKKTKKDTYKTVDIRPGIYSMKAISDEGKPLLELELAIGSVTNVRPEDVISALAKRLNSESLADAFICRTSLYVRGTDGTKSLWEI